LHRGLGYVEIKQDIRTGDYFILEPNIGRPTGRSAIAEAGGIVLLYTMYCDATGLPLPEDLRQSYGEAKWIWLRKDLQSALYHWREGDLTFREWWRSIRGKKAYALFSWSDPRPFFGDLWRTFRLLFQAEERKKRDYRNI
jgi:predicted ATP-grasp superfamily ATP-dependent carboligase